MFEFGKRRKETQHVLDKQDVCVRKQAKGVLKRTSEEFLYLS
jgi:hypothetical protein